MPVKQSQPALVSHRVQNTNRQSVKQQPHQMDTPLNKYKDLIDAIVNVKSSAHAIKTSFERRERGTSYGQLASRLAKEDRAAVLKLIAEVAEASVHDVLFKLVENQVKMQIGDTPLPDCPFGTSLHEDWATRVEGIPWPDEE